MTVKRTQVSETTRVWDEHSARLRRFIRRHVSNPADVDDVLQETFHKVHKGLPSLKQPEKIVSWLYQIARNAIADHHRRPQSAALPEGFADSIADDTALEHASVDAFQETAQCLTPMVRRLPARYRKAIDLVDFRGVAQDEVAQRLGISLSGAKSRIQRARSKLKNMLEACCRFEFDRRGRVIDFEPNDGATLCANGC